MKNNSRALIGGAAVAVVTVGLTVGLASASAAPQHSPGTTIGVGNDPANSANYIVRIQGCSR